MPRRTSGRKPTLAQAICDAPPHIQLENPPNNLDALRKHWKWAATSQFLITFAPLFSNFSFSLSEVEQDLAHGYDRVLSKVMQRLLYALTYDRKIGPDTWQDVLRKQYQKRDPLANPIGSERPFSSSSGDLDGSSSDDEKVAVEERSEGNQGTPNQTQGTSSPKPPRNCKDWNILPSLTKLDSLHLVTEWLFQNPTRIRTLMRVEEEDAVAWRIEPIGHDGKRNAYWLIGTRLWIQRARPSPRDGSKRKRPSITKGKARPPPAKRRRLREVKSTTSVQPRQRAAKIQAKQRLNKQIAVSQSVSIQRSMTTLPTSRPIGTRTSTRLRGQQRDEWQDVSPEWLEEPKQQVTPTSKTGLESDEDSISDLTELSESDHDHDRNSSRTKSPCRADLSDDAHSTDDIVEWETICITIEDWERFAQQLAKATHYAERALYKHLSQFVMPFVIQELREQERQKRLEEALIHRKRSSRIAIKESEKAEAASRKRAEEQERNGREKRLEARILANTQTETPRERRRREREEKDALRRTNSDTISTDDPSMKTRSSSLGSRDSIPNSLGTQGEEWVLDCEICHKHGVNPDDASPMMSCGRCSRWQHIGCHDILDVRAGRPKRNWDLVDFICRQCQSSQPNLNQPRQNSTFETLRASDARYSNNISPRIPELGATSSSSHRHLPYPVYNQPMSLHYTHALAHQEFPKSSASLSTRLHHTEGVFPGTHYIQPVPCATMPMPLCHGQVQDPNTTRPGSNISSQPPTYHHQYSQWQIPLPSNELNREAPFRAPQFNHYRTSYPSTS